MNRTLSLIITAAALAGCGSQAQEGMPPPPEVSVAEVVARDVRLAGEFTGRIEAVERVELKPRVSGYIASIGYDEGTEVERGSLLFVIDQRPYRAALAQAEAAHARATTQASLADAEVARAQRLAAARAISTEVLEQRTAAAAEAAAGVRMAAAALDVARLDLEFTEVRAPVAGRAGRALVTVGNLAQADMTTLTTIMSLDPVYVYFDAAERTLPRNAGSDVRVALDGESGFPHAGRVDFIDNRVDPGTGTLRARAVLANPDRTLVPGSFARVQLLGDAPTAALLIDEQAVLTDQDRKFVYVVGADGTAQRRDVQLGRSVDGLRIVESGLEAGERVIVRGVQKVFFPGMPVQAQPVEMDAGG